MIEYAFINRATDIVENICSWGDKKIADNYPVLDSQYMLELVENDYKIFEQAFKEGKRIRILDKDNLAYEEFVEEVTKLPTEEEILRDRINLIEAAMNDMLLGGV
jgi:methyl coenzyme M reductase subunit C-like uncharacterized protein (methanogenesis marker protein 7)